MSAKFSIEKGPFEPTWESLARYRCPDWFKDAKLGIWSHWGPQSVPMYGDWYTRHMYMEGHPQYLHHWRVYGHPSKVGYKDIVKRWGAEQFNPEELMDLYARAGAKYFVAQATHHDNFDNWDSKYQSWNSVRVGPKKDIVGLWRDAAKTFNLPFGVTEHLERTFRWGSFCKGSDQAGPYAGVPYDGSDPAYVDLYLDNAKAYEWFKQEVIKRKGALESGKPWWSETDPDCIGIRRSVQKTFPSPEWWKQRWYDRVKDVLDKYEPELLYSDSSLPFEDYGLNIVAHLYNSSVRRNGENMGVYNMKTREEKVYSIGVLDLKRTMQQEIFPHPWQTDTSVGDWFYNVRDVYKTAREVIELLVDIASKNGNLLLNFPQKPDGSLDDECLHILSGMENWIEVNGEGVYATRPWRIAGEGADATSDDRVREDALSARAWSPRDFRFTEKDGTVYAFQLGRPDDGKVLIKSFSPNNDIQVREVGLLGFDGSLKFQQDGEGLRIQLPLDEVRTFVHCFRIVLG